MSAVIWLGLILMWVIILVPMWLRRHDEAAEARSVDRFSSAMHTLSRREREREAAAGGNFVVMPNRTQSLEVHVSGASDPAVPAQRASGRSSSAEPASSSASASSASASRRAADKKRLRAAKRKAAQARRANRARRVKPPLTAAARRRRTLLGLVAAVAVTLAAAVLLGGLIWAAQGVVDIALLAFVAHLRNRARPAQVRRRAPARPASPPAEIATRHPASEVVVVGYGGRAAAREEIYDDRAVPLPVTQPAASRQVAAAEGFFDQTAVYGSDAAPAAPLHEDLPYDETLYEDALPKRAATGSDVVYDHEAPAAPAVEEIPNERIEAYARELDLDLPPSQPLRKPARSPESDDDIGARPWEPVPVPPPTYTTKPAAPARRTRAPLDEPLLPPTETAAELNPIDDLQEILDRRWAVND